MSTAPALIWRDPPPEAAAWIAAGVARAAGARRAPTAVFFRADDIGVPGARFEMLIRLFARHRAPLCLAVVPAWLTPQRWAALARVGQRHPDLWCWHQHGWRHQNHEIQGKKQEFGPARSDAALARDLAQGRARLAALMGPDFCPVFTPPWNRCTAAALQWLKQNGYRGLSRSRGSQPASPAGLPEWPVDIDLHTIRAADRASGWRTLLEALEQSLTNTHCGVMIHHQRMNLAAFEALDLLLGQIRRYPRFQLTDFRQSPP
jgi:hypothetical protein